MRSAYKRKSNRSGLRRSALGRLSALIFNVFDFLTYLNGKLRKHSISVPKGRLFNNPSLRGCLAATVVHALLQGGPTDFLLCPLAFTCNGGRCTQGYQSEFSRSPTPSAAKCGWPLKKTFPFATIQSSVTPPPLWRANNPLFGV